MIAEPAAALGIPLRLLAEAPGVSAAQVIPDHEVGDYTDLTTLRLVTDGCEVVTFDHEHVPTEHLHALQADGIAVRPGPDALVHAQDKAVMRAALGRLGIPCPRNAVVASVEDVDTFGYPCVLKTTRGGYDGKGVWFATSPADATEALEAAEATERISHDCLVLRVHEGVRPGADGDAVGLERVQVLGRHVLVVERDHLAAVGDQPERGEVGVVADLVVRDHL
ncbi:MAG TPA: ATP-grasp domain-containing protein, partial [Marmoricola sp.]|nr:ATP-grasp domain-containing protein [Marmoricola sp.]